MDMWLLGAAAIVLIAITVWIVWPARRADAPEPQAPEMAPQGDQFEDQYTSATADLSAGGVAIATSEAPASPTSMVAPEPTPYQSAGEPWSLATIARERAAIEPAKTPTNRPRNVSLSAAVLLTVGGAIGGAYLYARWQRERNKPINRLKRRFIPKR
jgi:hypothetical protein